jgi:hypothetical protein
MPCDVACENEGEKNGSSVEVEEGSGRGQRTVHQPCSGIIRSESQREPPIGVDARGVPTWRRQPIEVCGVRVKSGGSLSEDEEVMSMEVDGMRNWGYLRGLLL